MQMVKLTAQQLQEAYEEYTAGGISMRALCKKYGVSECAIPYHFRKMGWKGPGKNPVKHTGTETRLEAVYGKAPVS